MFCYRNACKNPYSINRLRYRRNCCLLLRRDSKSCGILIRNCHWPVLGTAFPLSPTEIDGFLAALIQMNDAPPIDMITYFHGLATANRRTGSPKPLEDCHENRTRRTPRRLQRVLDFYITMEINRE